MSDKEERILITQWNIKDNTCPVPVNSQCYTTKSCDDCKVGISKQEAIHKIAVALCVADGNVDCDECIYRGTDNCKTQLKNWYLKDAEVALDALLGDK